jgi:uncharacterized membrane protein
LNTLAGRTTRISFVSGTNTTTILNNTVLATVSFTGNINTFTKTQFDNAIDRTNSLTVNCQDTLTSLQSQITGLGTKTTGISYTAGTLTTTITNNTSLANVDFTGNINTFTKIQFDNAINRTNSLTVNCQDTLTSLQTQITGLGTKTTGISYSGTTTTIANTLASSTLTFSGTLNTISTTTFGYLSGVSSSIQTQLNSKKLKKLERKKRQEMSLK